MSRSQQLQTDVWWWQEEIQKLTREQRRIMEESRAISIKIEDANKKIQERQHELTRALEEEARDSQKKAA
ncbi:MAG: hypothetical protein WCT29_02100 [Candidatus Paceibacterota bacterium]|jgi:hypothetical protein